MKSKVTGVLVALLAFVAVAVLTAFGSHGSVDPVAFQSGFSGLGLAGVAFGVGAIDMFDTRTMTRMMENLYSPTTYLRDLLFSTAERHTTRYVDIDIVKGGRKVAAYVNPMDEGKKIDKAGYTTQSYKAPYTKQKMVTTAQEFLTREAGVTVYSSDTPAGRAQRELGSNLRELGEQIDRLEELQAAQAIQEGKITVKGEGIEDEVDFGFAAAQLPVLVGNALWSAHSTATPLADLQGWHEEVRKRSGLVPSSVIVDSTAVRHLLKCAELQTTEGALSPFRIQLGQINPTKMNAQGVKYWGYLQDPGIDLWSYDAYYEDPVSGITMPYIKEGSVIMIGEGARATRHYGAIEDLDATAQTDRFAKSWISKDPSARWVMVQSAPLLVPHQADAFLCATVL